MGGAGGLGPEGPGACLHLNLVLFWTWLPDREMNPDHLRDRQVYCIGPGVVLVIPWLKPIYFLK
jgi:hypothetical protein